MSASGEESSSSSFDIDSEGADSGDPLAHQLAEAKAELHALEQLVEELPQFYEAKFTQGLAVVMHANRQLALQQAELRQSIAALPPARTAWSFRLPQVDWLRMAPWALAAALALGVGWGVMVFNHRRAVPQIGASASLLERPGASPQPTLVLRAQGASWVEVQDLATREVLLMGTLEAGQQRTIRLRQGLRIRSGRPDLLTVQIDAQPVIPFGSDVGLGWRTFRTAGA